MAALAQSGSAVALLAEEWRQFFFPEADNAQFADAYAQTVAYALLLARLSGAVRLDPNTASNALDQGNGLLARALALLGHDRAREELRVGFELLQRSLEALDVQAFQRSQPRLWLNFYEKFLAAYDSKLRKAYGVYYTPIEVVELQVRLVSELLEDRFGKRLGFADDDVTVLDPAVGTGAYLVSIVDQALERVQIRAGDGAMAGRATSLAENLYGFEVLVGPYAVAHLRLKQTIEGVGGTLPILSGGMHAERRLKIYLADALSSPNEAPPGGLDLTHQKLTQEHEAAREVKQSGRILVCLGNPPYDRQTIEDSDAASHRKGGWVRFGDRGQGRVDDADLRERPILQDFIDPARRAGAGLHLKNIYNDYVYFWRWALWRLFEQQGDGGIISFITASSYLGGPGFVGMREVMRRTFDDLWIIDLGGSSGTRKTPNVFQIQTPVTI
ncbi:MAG: N-6 DNA methylase, partial [Caulobacteraceae bacterium]|nr:N-6 DNA methylase [Caulobacteraceae bacterium]